jgi:chromosome segregation ATPase
LAVVLMMLAAGCTESASAEQTPTISDDPIANAEAERATLSEQLEAEKAKLEQRELDLQSAQGMLAALLDKPHPDEELVATYQELTKEVEADVEKIKADIARIEKRLRELDEQLNGIAPSSTLGPVT